MPRVKITEAVFGREDTGVAVLLDGASVQVDVSGGGAATVYESDSGGTTITNPLTSDNGVLPGYLVEGSYTLTVTYDGVTGDPVPFEARAAYPSGAADGDVLSYDSGTGEVEWANPGELAGSLPWLIDINPFVTAHTQTNWSTMTKDDTQVMNGRVDSTGAQNAEIGWDVVLAAGTWTVSVMSLLSTDAGIMTVSLDGSEKGTIDFYAGSGSSNSLKTITGDTVSTTGKKRLLIKMATKNASSSSYYGRISALRLLRTA